MSLTDRDKKLAMLLLPMLVLAGYWFLVLSPQRSEVSALDEKLMTAEAARDESVANQQRLSASRNSYASDYETVVRLGKAIPSTLDMPSLLVQLESAAKGTGIDFDSITVGQRTSAAPAAGGSSTPGGSEPPVAAGGDKAQTDPGTATEQANEGADEANERAGASGGSTGTGGSGGTPSGTASPVAGLDTVPLNFSFDGSYFELANFFHRVKRFVRVANSDIKVKGRLMTIDGMALKTDGFPKITAEMTATIYLSPKSQGATGGGTAQGPSGTPASTPTSPPPAGGSPPASAPTQSSGETPQ